MYDQDQCYLDSYSCLMTVNKQRRAPLLRVLKIQCLPDPHEGKEGVAL